MALKLKADQILLLLLVFVPITLVLEYVVHASATTLFVTSAVAIVPLAGIMGKSTEMLAEHVGAGLGGLLNATFGNAAELIIAIFALRAGLHDLVKASLTGSIIGNILLIFGLSALLGGLKFRKQVFNRTAAKLGSTLLLLSAVGLVIPSLLHYLRDGAESGAAAAAGAGSGSLSLEISVVLIVCYILSLVFALRTHADLYQGTGHADGATHGAPAWSKGKSFAVLVGAAAVVGWMSEILVGGAEEAAHSLGMTEVFVGVIVVALVGNAAEHSTAVLVALRNKMDLSIQIAVGSSLQIALLIAPLLVFLSYAVGPAPIDLVFSPLEVVAVAVSVLVVGQIADDGQTHWMEGVLLLAVYVVLGLAFFNLPG
ncbi:calcium/proton exchanger [Candidatus Palauibacter polyketidifaciens]|uniref:calcium/proton exchanger n=1 Tax=Candidatus Palauibacter polyketidifaciens TaxID=3056740 RepID=UPI0023A2697E|nr:calcium/proton exchanger [Candidatus Palauibacter polyketidifaciens]MDE2720758.1 calcium/proton exchanger [Candidatus Palauibacter polyketidifaciens]